METKNIIKLVACFIIGINANLSAATFKDIRTNARILVNDVGPNSTRYINEMYNDWINEGQRIADISTLCTYRSFTFQLVRGTTYYSMPTDFLSITRVTRDYLSLQEMTPAGMDGRSAEWENQSGLPTYYFLNFSSRTKIGFAPWPSLASDTGTIKVEYVAYSPTLTSDSDIPFNSIVEFYPYHYALSFYAAYKASVIDERDSKAKVYMESFASIAKLMKEQCTSRPNYRPQMIGKQ